MMNYVKNQWSWSLKTLSKGSKWSRIWGIRVALKLRPKIAIFKSVFKEQIIKFLKKYNVKKLSAFFCWYKGSIYRFNLNRGLIKDKFVSIHGKFSNWFGNFESIRVNFSDLFGRFKLVRGKRISKRFSIRSVWLLKGVWEW